MHIKEDNELTNNKMDKPQWMLKGIWIATGNEGILKRDKEFVS